VIVRESPVSYQWVNVFCAQTSTVDTWYVLSQKWWSAQVTYFNCSLSDQDESFVNYYQYLICSSLPSDAYFEQLDQDKEHNKSGTSEDIDRVSSLRTVRRSILNQKSLCPDEDIDFEEPSTSTLSDSAYSVICAFQNCTHFDLTPSS
jgi:hypothetical protein